MRVLNSRSPDSPPASPNFNSCAAPLVLSSIHSDGVTRGSSQAAAKDSLIKCSLARVIWVTPLILMPPLLMAALERLAPARRFFAKYRFARAGAELAIITSLLWTALPMAIAVFPQQVTADVRSLESRFHALTDQRGQPVTALTYNKGL